MTNHCLAMTILLTRKWFAQSAVCLAMLASCARAGSTPADTPFGWLSGETGTAASSLRRALSAPGMKRMPQEMTADDASRLYLDMAHSFGIRDREAFRSRACEVLDAAVSAERRVEAARKSSGGDARCDAACRFLKYRLKFAQALARVEISRRMAASDSSYCSQAMESAIDCLKASAEERDEFEKLRSRGEYRRVVDLPADAIRALRGELLRVWESSKSLGSTAPIRDMDAGLIVNQTVVSGVKEKRARREIEAVFGWMKRDSSGNRDRSIAVDKNGD